jgi:hypothetical protein
MASPRAPRWARHPERAIERLDPPAQTAQPRPGGVSAAHAVVGNLHAEDVAVAQDPDVHALRLRVLAGVGERLGHQEVGRALHRRRRTLGDVRVHRHAQRARVRQRRDRRLEAAIGQHGRVDPASEVAQLLERLARALARLLEHLSRALGISRHLLLGHADAHPERHQPRLRAVVQVALDAAQLGLLLVHRTGTGGGERFDPLGELGVIRRSEEQDCGADGGRNA